MFTFVSCSDEKETNINEGVNQKILSEKGREKGEIPSSMAVNQMLYGAIKPASFSEIVKLYKKDISQSKDTDFDTNLKNMWLIVINNSLLNGEGTEDQKKFFVYEQVNLEHNVPHIDKFFSLLSITNSIDSKEKEALIKEYTEKNQKAINQIVWQSPEEKKQKEQQLLLAGRNYGLLHPSK